MSLHILLLMCAFFSVAFGSRCRYRETRLTERVIVGHKCNPRISQLGEDYWTSIGYDGRLRNGRRIDDFLTLPKQSQNDVREGWVAFWITHSRYGRGRHYETFGHAYLRANGRVCAWFPGLDRDAIELCGGFRVLSRNKRNPDEEMPFEWIQAGYARPREAIGFRNHRIAKYEWSPDDVLFGDAHLRSGTFRGVSPISRFYIQTSARNVFTRKVWVLRRKPESKTRNGDRGQYRWSTSRNDERKRYLNGLEVRKRLRPSWSPTATRNRGQTPVSRAQQYLRVSQQQAGYPWMNEKTGNHKFRNDVQRHPLKWTSKAEARKELTNIHGEDARAQTREQVPNQLVKQKTVYRDENDIFYEPITIESVERQRALPTTISPSFRESSNENLYSTPMQSRRISDYERERANYHKNYLEEKKRRRLDAAKRRAEEEKQYKERMMTIPERKLHTLQSTTAEPQTTTNEILHNEITHEFTNTGREVFSYPDRLPGQREILKDELEDFVK